MAFPSNPAVNDTYTDATGTVWSWSGTNWYRKTISANNETLYGPKIPLGGQPGQVLSIDSNNRRVWQTQAFNFATLADVDSRVLTQMGSSFSNRTVLLNSDLKISADGEVGAPDPNKGPGWYYKNTEGNKINWYFYGGANATGYQLNSFDGWYAVIEIRATGSFPYLVVYTEPTGSGDASWYKSRINYADEPTTQALAPGLYLFHTAGLNVTGIYSGLTRVPLPVSDNSVGTQAGTETVWTMALSTSSGLPAGTNEFVVREQAVSFGGVTTTYQHVALPTFQAPYTSYYKGAYSSPADFPESGELDQWLIETTNNIIYVWNVADGGWVATGAGADSTTVDSPLPYVYDSDTNDHGYGFANAEGNWLLTAGGGVRPENSTKTSANRIMLGRLTEPGDTVTIEGISEYAARPYPEFALVAWMESEDPVWANNKNWGTGGTQTNGWTNNSPGNERQLSVIGGTANRFQLAGHEASWNRFNNRTLYHRDFPISSAITFRLCETGRIQLFIRGEFLAESSQTVTVGVGFEVWLLAPEAREYPSPTGALNGAAWDGVPTPQPVNVRYYMTTVNPTTEPGFIELLASGNGYWLYTAGDAVNPESVVLTDKEAEDARASRVFVDYTGLTLEERAEATAPIVSRDGEVLSHVEYLARGYFHSLDLSLVEIQEKMALYADALAAAKAGSVELCLASLQGLTVPTAATSGNLAFTPNYTFDGTYTNHASENYHSGDVVYDTYGIDELDFSDSFITVHFKDSASFNAWRSQNRQITLDYPSGTKSWEGTHSLNVADEYSYNGTSYIHYQPATLTSNEKSDLADTLAAAGAGTSVLNYTIDAPTPQSPAVALGEQDVVNELITVLTTHLQKFPR